ncbi:MAG TPA: glycosyltransferase, partial [Syntrophobacteraceae bacterium]|nr:glycosyltransferase [Syntrophobacteraceae bacterium]
VVAAGKNKGFISACNAGARHAHGEYLCFLNNDTLVTPTWLEQLVDTIRIYPACGAVGAKLVYPEGTLQEAGSMLWRDGATRGYGREDDPFKPEYCYLREVAYCSAACLLVRTDLFERLGGYDTLFEPSYYEDVDLCMRLWQLGYKVVYQPASTVIHLEFSSSSTDKAVDLMKMNKTRFQERWFRQLRFLPEHAAANILTARDIRKGKTVLFADDRIPTASTGPDSSRAYKILRHLAGSGHLVTVFPLSDPTPYQPDLRNLQQMGVEVFHSPYAELDTFLHDRAGYYSAVLTTRTRAATAYLQKIRTAWPATAVVYDAEALPTSHQALPTDATPPI